ncbi:addiction module protein [Hyalangium rubrum]|uniref:Addiction module protein n=1 Tax=Hyalangium rubrum TaxID=3103134 RepID=A0ABU5H8D5_9BACT|nr:addiction module protein [Hyalangium sp. s54d21]MDY7229032.1 addiction module protein [Hyalangium sp. s54d21]
MTLSRLLHLSVAERIQLVEDLWDSVAAYPEQVETSPEQLAELEKRLAELDAAPEGRESWDEVKARILKSL